MRFFWGRTQLGGDDICHVSQDGCSDSDEELSASGPKGSLFSFLEGGLHAAFSAISSAVCSGVAIVSGSPSKRARVDTVQRACAANEPPPSVAHPVYAPTSPAAKPPPASPRAAEQHIGTPTKRLASFHSSFAPPSPPPRVAVSSPTRRSGGGGSAVGDALQPSSVADAELCYSRSGVAMRLRLRVARVAFGRICVSRCLVFVMLC